VEVRIAALQFKVAEPNLGRAFEDCELRLIVLVRKRVRLRRLDKSAQARLDAGRGQVLDLAVVLVPAAVLTYLGDGQIPDGTQPGVRLSHARHITLARLDGVTGIGRPRMARIHIAGIGQESGRQ